jgi:hypothetical protein
MLILMRGLRRKEGGVESEKDGPDGWMDGLKLWKSEMPPPWG